MNKLTPWTRQERKIVHDGYLRVVRDIVSLPNNQTIVYDSILQNDCACILCILDASRIVLVRQYRYVTNEVTWEIPMGGLQTGEHPVDAARRELREETGLVVSDLLPLGTIVPSNGQSPQRMHMFLARDATRSEASPEPSEFLEIHELPIDIVYSYIGNGLITDAATLAALLLAERAKLLG